LFKGPKKERRDMLNKSSVSETGVKELPRRKPNFGMGHQDQQSNEIKQVSKLRISSTAGYSVEETNEDNTNTDEAVLAENSVEPVEVVAEADEIDARPYTSRFGSVVTSSSHVARALQLSFPGARRYGLAVLFPQNLKIA
jgi:hypothetical protein